MSEQQRPAPGRQKEAVQEGARHESAPPQATDAPAPAPDVDGWRSPEAEGGPATPEHAAIVARIDSLRDEIDRLDAQLVQLLSARAGCALEIGQLKKRLALEIYQPAREQAVLRHVREVNTGPLDGDAIARLFERIIDEARRLERVEQERGRREGPPGPGHRGA